MRRLILRFWLKFWHFFVGHKLKVIDVIDGNAFMGKTELHQCRCGFRNWVIRPAPNLNFRCVVHPVIFEQEYHD